MRTMTQAAFNQHIANVTVMYRETWIKYRNELKASALRRLDFGCFGCQAALDAVSCVVGGRTRRNVRCRRAAGSEEDST